MNRITQEARSRQTVVKLAMKKEKSFAARQHAGEFRPIFEDASKTEKCPFDKALEAAGILHKLLPPRTPWHNGKVERSHRNDQRYFYDWEKFADVKELNDKLKMHLAWSNQKPMRTLEGKSPLELLQEKLAVI